MQRLIVVIRWLFGLLFVLAGVNHFRTPAFYERMMPPYLPDPGLLVQLSGIAEIGLGALLLFARTRRLAGWGLVALLVAVFPANLYMAQHPELFPQFKRGMLYGRLPLQLVLIAWAWCYTRPDRGAPRIATRDGSAE